MRLARSRFFVIFYCSRFRFFLAKMMNFVIMRRVEIKLVNSFHFICFTNWKSKRFAQCLKFCAVNFCYAFESNHTNLRRAKVEPTCAIVFHWLSKFRWKGFPSGQNIVVRRASNTDVWRISWIIFLLWVFVEISSKWKRFRSFTNVSQNCLYILKTETVSSNRVLNPSNCPNNVFLNSGGWFSKQSRTCACPFSNPKDAFGIVSTKFSSWLLFWSSKETFSKDGLFLALILAHGCFFETQK